MARSAMRLAISVQNSFTMEASWVTFWPVSLIRAEGAQPVGVAISLDRQERGQGSEPSVQEVERNFNLRVISIATLDDLLEFISDHAEYSVHLDAIQTYRKAYGI